MSRYREDWKTFDVWSGEMTVMDIADSNGGNRFPLTHVGGGEWAAFAEYDDDSSVRHVVAGELSVLEALASNDGGSEYRHRFSVLRDSVKSDSGVVGLVDSAFVDAKSIDEKPGGWVPDLVEAWGLPTDESKSEHESFVETACHLSIDSQTGKPDIGSNGHGVFFGVPRGTELEFVVLYDSDDGMIRGMETIIDR